MFTSLLMLSFIFLLLIILSCNYRLPFITNIRLSIIETALLCSLLILFFTEGMSACNALTRANTIFLWGLAVSSLAGIFFYNYITRFRQLSFDAVQLDLSDKILIAFSLFFILLPLLFIALYYPPNNGDSLWYHLPRVEHWIANGNVNHYRTLCPNQLYHQPFAEFILLHLRLLSGSDFLYNMVQFLAMLFSLITVSLMVKLWGLNYRFQLLTAMLALSIPMGIMQATSTQTDYVASFFCITFIYFGLRLITYVEGRYANTVFAAIALGLGILTKMTVAVYALPFGVMFAWHYLKNRRAGFYKLGMLFAAMVSVINIAFYLRNYLYTGVMVGSVAISNMMLNETLSVSLFLSNIIRNCVLHLFIPSEYYLSLLLKMIRGFHFHVLQISPEEGVITFLREKFRVFFFMDENFIGSFMLIFFAVAMLIYCCLQWRQLKQRQPLFLWYIVALLVGFLLFSAVFKWQVYHTRLHLPLSVAFIPAITYFLYDLYTYGSSVLKRLFVVGFFLWFGLFSFPFFWNYNNVHKRVFVVLLLGALSFYVISCVMKRSNIVVAPLFTLSYFVLVSSLPFVFFHTARPLLLNIHAVTGSREDKYFIGLWSDEYRRQCQVGADMLRSLGISTVATDENNEYLLWALLRNRFQQYEVVPYTHGAIPKIQKKCEYRAILTKSDDTIKSYDNDKVQLYKVLGPLTPKGNLRLIVLKTNESLMI